MKKIEQETKSALINWIGAIIHAYKSGDLDMVDRMITQWDEKSQTKAIVSNDAFTQFWGLYPRKIGKSKALEAFNRALTRGATVSQILDGTALFARIRNEKVRRDASEEQFTPHATTWLNQDRFTAIDSYNRELRGLLGNTVITALSVVGYDEPSI